MFPSKRPSSVEDFISLKYYVLTQVVMGGGRANFYPNTVNDVEYDAPYNQRLDNRTLPQVSMLKVYSFIIF